MNVGALYGVVLRDSQTEVNGGSGDQYWMKSPWLVYAMMTAQCIPWEEYLSALLHSECVIHL